MIGVQCWLLFSAVPVSQTQSVGKWDSGYIWLKQRKIKNMDSVNFVEIAQLVSSLAMVVSVIYLARQISEEKIPKKWSLVLT